MNMPAQDVRERLLSLLLQTRGCFLSGETVSQDMGITRAAVWKHMQSLQKAGWPLESVTRKGYRLLEGNPFPYSAAGIQSALREIRQKRSGAGARKVNALDSVIAQMDPAYEDIDWRVTLLDRVDSTSTRLKEMAAAGEPEGRVLLAETQTAGRGRLGRQWISRTGLGIWMSVLLRPEMAPDQVQSLTLAASVAVVRALQNWLLELADQVPEEGLARQVECLVGEVGIKWPNDILWKGRKLCGILTELAAEPDRLSHVVIGIGLNVAQEASDFPPELQEAAASVVQWLQAHQVERMPDRNRLAGHLLHALSDVCRLHRSGRMPEILDAWRHVSVTLGKEIRIMDPAAPWSGTALDVGEDGRLRVRKDNGLEQWLLSGEISIREGRNG